MYICGTKHKKKIKMKKLQFSKFLIGGAFLALVLVGGNACKKDEDPCKDVTCQNGGTCDEGECICPTGYEGTNCETEERAKFFGTWRTTNETCTSGGPSTFDITITTNSGDISKINIANLYGAGFTAVATLTGNNVSIASQSFGTGSIVGSGSLSGTTLTLSYTVTGGGSSDNCNGVTFTKL